MLLTLSQHKIFARFFSNASISDINECSLSSHNCLPNFKCTNTDGSYLCTCDEKESECPGM